MAIGHSIFTQGPMHIPALHPGLYKFLSVNSVFEESFDFLPEMEDIPANAQTSDLIAIINEVTSYSSSQPDNYANTFFLLQLNSAESTEKIDATVDKYLAIINSSSWPTTRVVNGTTKYQLMQHLWNTKFTKRG